MTVLTPDRWNGFLEKYPDAHILQTTAWGDLKSAFGWRPIRLAVNDIWRPGAFPQATAWFFNRLYPSGPCG